MGFLISTKFHDNTEKKWIFIQDRHNPPRQKSPNDNTPEICNRSWLGHSSWWEGMGQKQWTVYTLGVILVAAREVGLHVTLPG